MDLRDIKTPVFEYEVSEIGTLSIVPLYFTEKFNLARKFPRMERASERKICDALVMGLGKILESPEGEPRKQKILIALLNRTKSQKEAVGITAKITHLSSEIEMMVASKLKIMKP